ncbi:TRAP transporter large permease [Xanthobacteraceae bacterium Astr-EGSB]|jgi:C4-dicarboxylate transporter DctM subunit|uniref:TRAP transporter large permease n=1 Tax=Astrobacterium formosum TaxID=3069710 RepID=UPI0027B26C45|nr:TRAP transporter large permease [Xanthobacteraceae bacterium Astr-EGSB]
MSIAVLLVVFFGLLTVGAPVAVALGGSAVLTSFLFSPIPPAIIGQKVLANVEHFTLMAVPFFFFAAALMETGGLVRRLVNLANAFVGHLRGGLGITSILSCMMFAAISGSSPATVAAIGRVLYPALVRDGYSPRYAIGSIATAGSLGILIPPSIPMIMYGFVTETSIARLFIAGVIPGLVYGTGLLVMAAFLARRAKVPLQPRSTMRQRWDALVSAGPALLLPMTIFVGIYGFPGFEAFGVSFEGGAIFTPTEAAIMAAALALVIGLLVYRETDFMGAVKTIVATAPSVGMIFFITINALLFAFFITQLGIPQAVSALIVALDPPQWVFLLMVNVLLIIVGFFLEGLPTVLMFVPILFPAAMALGVDPVHFCIIVVVNIELGLIHPPVGLNLYVGSAVSGLPPWEVFKAALPWLSVTLTTLLLVTYVPQLSLFLPGLMFR